MAYVDQLARHDPFHFQIPEVFSPWGYRLIDHLRHEFTDINWVAGDIRRMAKELDACLNVYAQKVLSDPRAKANLLAEQFSDDTRRLINKASTVDQIRSAASDLALKMASPIAVHHLKAAQPKGKRELDLFEIMATLSIWKMADAVDILSDGKITATSLSRATRYAMESTEAGHLALILEFSSQTERSEISNTSVTVEQTAQAAEEMTAADYKDQSSERAKVGANARRKKYGKLRAQVLQLANEGGYTKQYQAADAIAEIINWGEMERIKPSTVKTYLSQAGWVGSVRKPALAGRI